MEAIANYAFTPTESDELGFEKGSTLYIVGMEEDPNWYKARQGNREGMIPANYISLYPHPWYIPKCSRREAESRLLEIDPISKKDCQPNGAFILRQSENDPGQFSISVKEGSTVLHFRVFSDQNWKYYIWSNKFNSVNDLIDYHRHQTIYQVKSLLLRDCVQSKKFGPVGNGPNAHFDNPRLGHEYHQHHYHPSSNPSECHNSNSQLLANPSESKTHALSVSDLPPGISTTDLCGRHCIAKFDFNASCFEEMSFCRGYRLRILGEEDENWWFVELVNPVVTPANCHQPSFTPSLPPRGLIPANYVELLPVTSSHLHER